MEAVIFNKTKEQYLFIQDLADDPDYDTDYTIYDLYGRDQDGGCFNTETDDAVAEAIKEAEWTEDELLTLPDSDAEDFLLAVSKWGDLKIKQAGEFLNFNNRSKTWQKR